MLGWVQSFDKFAYSEVVPSASNALDYFFNTFYSSICGQILRSYFSPYSYATDGNPPPFIL